jgi:hypothetical protein
MMPIEPGLPPGSEEQPVYVPAPPDAPHYRWYHKLAGVVFVAFCLSMGLFLLIFPWTELWDVNYFSTWIPEWHQYWDNLYVRGAVSAIGVINVYISFVEMFRLRRFAK